MTPYSTPHMMLVSLLVQFHNYLHCTCNHEKYLVKMAVVPFVHAGERLIFGATSGECTLEQETFPDFGGQKKPRNILKLKTIYSLGKLSSSGATLWSFTNPAYRATKTQAFTHLQSVYHKCCWTQHIAFKASNSGAWYVCCDTVQSTVHD